MRSHLPPSRTFTRFTLMITLGVALWGCSSTMSATTHSDPASPSAGEEGAAGAAGAAAPSGEVISHRDLTYTPPPGVTSDLARLDVFRVDDNQRRPLVLLVHGGSWVSGDKENFEQTLVPWWLARGYVAAPVNFRLASRLGQPRAVLPRDQARDVAAALAWLLARAETYQLDPERVVLLGYSSGAHLVALLGTDEELLREAGLREEQVVGAISLDVHAYDVPYALGLMEGSEVEENAPLIRHLFGETEEEQRAGSPISYVGGWAAPSLVISVDEDPEEEGTHGYIVARAAARYVEALRAAGHQAETLHDRAEDHSSLVLGFGAPGDQVTEAVGRYLDALDTAP